MECRDAQFYLRLRRHAADEFGADVSGALEGHLAGCPLCARDAHAAESFDRAVARAMRNVPVPAGLREQLITRAAAKQGAVLRRKLYRAAAASAAAVVLLGIIFGVFSSNRPKVDTQALVEVNGEQFANPEESTRRWLAEQKLPDRLPFPFDYELHAYHGYEDVQGKKVPFVLFRNDNGFAKVYIFRRDGTFDLKGILDAQASRASARVMEGREEFRGVTYVFVHTGQDLQPFLRGRNPTKGV